MFNKFPTNRSSQTSKQSEQKQSQLFSFQNHTISSLQKVKKKRQSVSLQQMNKRIRFIQSMNKHTSLTQPEPLKRDLNNFHLDLKMKKITTKSNNQNLIPSSPASIINNNKNDKEILKDSQNKQKEQRSDLKKILPNQQPSLQHSEKLSNEQPARQHSDFFKYPENILIFSKSKNQKEQKEQTAHIIQPSADKRKSLIIPLSLFDDDEDDINYEDNQDEKDDKDNSIKKSTTPRKKFVIKTNNQIFSQRNATPNKDSFMNRQNQYGSGSLAIGQLDFQSLNVNNIFQTQNSNSIDSLLLSEISSQSLCNGQSHTFGVRIPNENKMNQRQKISLFGSISPPKPKNNLNLFLQYPDTNPPNIKNNLNLFQQLESHENENERVTSNPLNLFTDQDNNNNNELFSKPSIFDNVDEIDNTDLFGQPYFKNQENDSSFVNNKKQPNQISSIAEVKSTEQKSSEKLKQQINWGFYQIKVSQSEDSQSKQSNKVTAQFMNEGIQGSELNKMAEKQEIVSNDKINNPDKQIEETPPNKQSINKNKIMMTSFSNLKEKQTRLNVNSPAIDIQINDLNTVSSQEINSNKEILSQANNQQNDENTELIITHESKCVQTLAPALKQDKFVEVKLAKITSKKIIIQQNQFLQTMSPIKKVYQQKEIQVNIILSPKQISKAEKSTQTIPAVQQQYESKDTQTIKRIVKKSIEKLTSINIQPDKQQIRQDFISNWLLNDSDSKDILTILINFFVAEININNKEVQQKISKKLSEIISCIKQQKPGMNDLQSFEILIENMEKQQEGENHMELYEKLEKILNQKLKIQSKEKSKDIKEQLNDIFEIKKEVKPVRETRSRKRKAKEIIPIPNNNPQLTPENQPISRRTRSKKQRIVFAVPTKIIKKQKTNNKKILRRKRSKRK